MKILVDTNVLLRIADKSHAMHAEAVRAVDILDEQDHECLIVPQVLYEYWVVATRPKENNGLGEDVDIADLAIAKWTSAFRLLLDERGVFRIWRDLVNANRVKGKPAHDARLVAAMKRHSVTDLLTFNAGDFTRFVGIQVRTPAEVLAGKLPT